MGLASMAGAGRVGREKHVISRVTLEQQDFHMQIIIEYNKLAFRQVLNKNGRKESNFY